MDLDTALKKVIEKISFSKDEYEVCVADVKHIVNAIDLVSRKKSTPFSEIFLELGSCATFMKENAIDLMPDFNYFMPFKVPLKVKPIFQTYETKDSLYLKSKAKHPLVKDGYVSAEYFNVMLTMHINNTIAEVKNIKCGPRVYQLSWRIREMPNHVFGHNIKAIEIADQAPVEISFDFVPAFKFLNFETPMPNCVAENVEGARYWITYSAYVEDNISVFSKVTPRWQLLKPDPKCKTKNMVRLFKTMGRNHNDEHDLDVLRIKNVLFWRVQELGTAYDNCNAAVLFADLFGQLIYRFIGQLMPNLKANILKPVNNILMFTKPCGYERKFELKDLLMMFGLDPDI